MPKDTPVELTLDLKRHCIETAIRRRYDQTLGTYFKDENARLRLEKDIELLLQALETLDFSALRGTYGPWPAKPIPRSCCHAIERGGYPLALTGNCSRTCPNAKTPQRSLDRLRRHVCAAMLHVFRITLRDFKPCPAPRPAAPAAGPCPHWKPAYHRGTRSSWVVCSRPCSPCRTRGSLPRSRFHPARS